MQLSPPVPAGLPGWVRTGSPRVEQRSGSPPQSPPCVVGAATSPAPWPSAAALLQGPVTRLSGQSWFAGTASRGSGPGPSSLPLVPALFPLSPLSPSTSCPSVPGSWGLAWDLRRGQGGQCMPLGVVSLGRWEGVASPCQEMGTAGAEAPVRWDFAKDPDPWTSEGQGCSCFTGPAWKALPSTPLNQQGGRPAGHR